MTRQEYKKILVELYNNGVVATLFDDTIIFHEHYLTRDVTKILGKHKHDYCANDGIVSIIYDSMDNKIKSNTQKHIPAYDKAFAMDIVAKTKDDGCLVFVGQCENVFTFFMIGTADMSSVIQPYEYDKNIVTITKERDNPVFKRFMR